MPPCASHTLSQLGPPIAARAALISNGWRYEIVISSPARMKRVARTTLTPFAASCAALERRKEGKSHASAPSRGARCVADCAAGSAAFRTPQCACHALSQFAVAGLAKRPAEKAFHRHTRHSRSSSSIAAERALAWETGCEVSVAGPPLELSVCPPQRSLSPSRLRMSTHALGSLSKAQYTGRSACKHPQKSFRSDARPRTLSSFSGWSLRIALRHTSASGPRSTWARSSCGRRDAEDQRTSGDSTSSISPG
eukprot:3454187-Pleurochrysis_carterae.AAC.4